MHVCRICVMGLVNSSSEYLCENCGRRIDAWYDTRSWTFLARISVAKQMYPENVCMYKVRIIRSCCKRKGGFLGVKKMCWTLWRAKGSVTGHHPKSWFYCGTDLSPRGPPHWDHFQEMSRSDGQFPDLWTKCLIKQTLWSKPLPLTWPKGNYPIFLSCHIEIKAREMRGDLATK